MTRFVFWWILLLCSWLLGGCVDNTLTRAEWTELQRECRYKARTEAVPPGEEQWEYDMCVKRGLHAMRTVGDVRDALGRGASEPSSQ